LDFRLPILDYGENKWTAIFRLRLASLAPIIGNLTVQLQYLDVLDPKDRGETRSPARARGLSHSSTEGECESDSEDGGLMTYGRTVLTWPVAPLLMWTRF
jgi:hypothetical protein